MSYDSYVVSKGGSEKGPRKRRKVKRPEVGGEGPLEVRPPKVGVFIRDFLASQGESYASEIHSEYKKARRRWDFTEGKRTRVSTYSSFAAYISKLALMGLLEKTGKVEESDDPRAEMLTHPERVYLRLTEKGKRAPDVVWWSPLRIYYHPHDWELRQYRDYVKGAT